MSFNACVTEAVKQRILSRRDGFIDSAAGAAAATPGSTFAAQRARGVTDMAHTFPPEFPMFGRAPGIEFRKDADFGPDGYNLHQLMVDEQCGTHGHGPLHFSAVHIEAARMMMEKSGAPMMAAAPKLRGGTGGQARVIALH